MIKLLYIFSLFFILNGVHDFHLSKTDINYKTSENSLQLTVHLFIDDLEVGLKGYSHEALHIFNKGESIHTDSLIALYIGEHLNITIDGMKKEATFLGKEISDDLAGAWCYLEIENTEKFKTIAVFNSLLTSVFNDQKNIINFKIDNSSKAFHIMDKENNFKEIKV